MLSLILKDKGSRFHNKISESNYLEAKDKFIILLGDPEIRDEFIEDLISFAEQYTADFEWFDINALMHCDKENLAKYVWLLSEPFELQLEKEGVVDKYGYGQDLLPTKKESKKFDKYFQNRAKIGTRFSFTWGGDWTIIFSSGFQLARTVLGPIGIIVGKIPFIALMFFMTWVGAAFFDWIFLSIPYFILWLKSGLPREYYDADLLIGPYLYGDIIELKNDLRELVANDKQMSEAYEAALWAIFMRQKYIEIIRKNRKNEINYKDEKFEGVADKLDLNKDQDKTYENIKLDGQRHETVSLIDGTIDSIQREIDKNLSKIQALFQEKAGELSNEIINNDQKLEEIVTDIHNTLPLPIRIVVSKKRLVQYCKDNRQVLIPLGKDTEPTGSSENTDHSKGIKLAASESDKTSVKIDEETDRKDELNHYSGKLPENSTIRAILNYLEFQHNFHPQSAEEYFVSFEFRNKRYSIELDKDDEFLYTIMTPIDSIDPTDYPYKKLIESVSKTMASSKVSGMKIKLPTEKEINNRESLICGIVIQNYSKNVELFLDSFIDIMATLTLSYNSFKDELLN